MKYLAHRIELRAVPAFADLPPSVLQQLQNMASLITVSAREVVFHQGEAATSLYIVRSGCLRLIEHTETGQDVSLQFLGPGDLFGLQALLENAAFPGRVEAIENSAIIRLNGEAFYELMYLHAGLSIRIIQMLLYRLHHAHIRIRQLITERVEQRLARTLINYSEKFGKPVRNGIEIHLRRQDLAEFTGTTVETVSRTLSQWEKEGYLRCGRQQIIIINAGALSQTIHTP